MLNLDTEVEPKQSWPLRLLPGIGLQAYLLVSWVLFFWGPWSYPVYDSFLFNLFIGAAHLALAIGYFLGIKVPSREGRFPISPTLALAVIILLNVLIIIPTSYVRTGRLIPDVLGGVINPGEAYELVQLEKGEASHPFDYLRIFIGPVIYGLHAAFFFWGSLRLVWKCALIIALMGLIGNFIAIGTNKAIFDSAVLVPVMIGASYLARHKRIPFFLLGGALVLLTVAMIFFFIFFSKAMESRRGSSAKVAFFPPTETAADLQHPLVEMLPDELNAGVLGLTLYVTHGYYALYLSLNEEFIPTFGFGNSMFLSRQMARFGYDYFEKNSYPVRIEKHGWDSWKYWSTFYTWAASDVSFVGVILIVFLVGYGLGSTWNDLITFKGLGAALMFSQFIIMVIYFPANNQCLQSGESLVAFAAYLGIWLWGRRKTINSGTINYPA